MTDGEAKDRTTGDEEIAWYSVLLQSWVTTRMERDKSILTLSGGGIGLLVTLLVSFGVKTQCEVLVYFISLTAFIMAVLCALWIFSRNSKYITRLHRNRKEHEADPLLGMLDRILIGAFITGIVATVALGLVTVQRRQQTEEGAASMTLKKDGSSDTGEDKRASLNELGELRRVDESLNQMAALRPDGRSLNNMDQMRPNSAGTETGSNGQTNQDTQSSSTEGQPKKE